MHPKLAGNKKTASFFFDLSCFLSFILCCTCTGRIIEHSTYRRLVRDDDHVGPASLDLHPSRAHLVCVLVVEDEHDHRGRALRSLQSSNTQYLLFSMHLTMIIDI